MGATCPLEQDRPQSIGLAETVCLVDNARMESVLSATNEAPESVGLQGEYREGPNTNRHPTRTRSL